MFDSWRVLPKNARLTSEKSDTIETRIGNYQMNTKIRLNSWVDTQTQTLCAFGVIYQELPEIPQQVSSKLGNYINSLPPMQELYMFNSDPDILAQKLIPDETKAIKSICPKFVCACSSEKVEEAVALFPLEDIEDMIHKANDVEVKCHYCGKNHVVTVKRIGEIYTKLLNLSHLN